MPPLNSKCKPTPSKVASEAKKHYIHIIREKYASKWNMCSYMYERPLLQIKFSETPLNAEPPRFYVLEGDPINTAMHWANRIG
ncbi:hypothetical protein C8A05DRAFT_39948, partial [Staphylotrichum tortipilum]